LQERKPLPQRNIGRKKKLDKKKSPSFSEKKSRNQTHLQNQTKNKKKTKPNTVKNKDTEHTPTHTQFVESCSSIASSLWFLFFLFLSWIERVVSSIYSN